MLLFWVNQDSFYECRLPILSPTSIFQGLYNSSLYFTNLQNFCNVPYPASRLPHLIPKLHCPFYFLINSIRLFHHPQRIIFSFSPCIYKIIIILTTGITTLSAWINTISLCNSRKMHYHSPAWSVVMCHGINDISTTAHVQTSFSKRHYRFF